ncbi:MAG: hypothetical protein ACKVW3_09395 [Phycisphaerales bacterium]
MNTATDDDRVDPCDACPLCSERRVDMLVWIDDDRVECTMCGMVYQPGNPPIA